MHRSFYSNGKLLITGEYLVLQGASALAVPLKFGQSLKVGDIDGITLKWSAQEHGKEWFSVVFSLPALEVIQSRNDAQALHLRKLLTVASRLNPAVLDGTRGYEVHTDLNFNLNWGLGSSSTLVSNIASWFAIDPFELFFSVHNGSGYDIACARADHPIIYQLKGNQPLVKKVDFHPSFHNNIFFVYTGKKQDSTREVGKFRQIERSDDRLIGKICELTGRFVSAQSLDAFNQCIEEHEWHIADILGIKPARESRFSDFPGSIKSLGAWGGDFLMVTFRDSKEALSEYMRGKNIDTVFSFDEIVL